MRKAVDNDGDAKTEALVLSHLNRLTQALQTEAEAFNRRDMLHSGMYSEKVADLTLTELRFCLTALADSYSTRGLRRADALRRAAIVFDQVTHSFTKTVTSLVRHNPDTGYGLVRFREVAAIYNREALQHLELAMANRPKTINPYLEKVGIPIISAIIGGLIGHFLR